MARLVKMTMEFYLVMSIYNGMYGIIKHHNARGDINMAKEENKVEQEIKRCFVMMPFTTPEGYEKTIL